MGSSTGEAGRADDTDEDSVERAKSFYMGVYHVTQGEYVKVMGKNPSWFFPTVSSRGKLTDRAARSYPVANVSGNALRQFCEKLTGTEAVER
ncbi:hypothetical protein [Fimbriiglobus ruber]|uniref:Sulfatase-modifying factor enzyme domain-containing protein n=1 Tax=Fimbriiglobus ruber TaxID=1908690 RepID=A0A225DPD8_9BACT|nr:hypothetical protein [Fimbriiglobus ruber]OWK39069.1 hypothetical protein FRUB_06151 [Fimbriiglobus ruber]